MLSIVILKAGFLRRWSGLLSAALLAACAQMPTTGELTEAESRLTPPAVAVTTETDTEDTTIAATSLAKAKTEAPVAAAAGPKDIWDRIRRGYALPEMDNELVRLWEQRYTAKPEYFVQMVERSSHYLFHIMEEVERRKIPAEIALLPMIESAFNPQAYSRAHASGLWQFIPSTGKLYGLRQNWWYDGRRDVIAATGAALDYLEKLYGEFNDWELALASYNWGEGAVGRAVERNRARGLPANYESLTMPAETRNYIPKLIAVKNIIAEPEKFGIRLSPVPNEPYFEVVRVEQHMDVKVAAALAGMTVEEFRFLNPAHNKRVINADTAETIVLPRDRVSQFREALKNYDEPLLTWQAHTIRRGETPDKIAKRYGTSVARLKEVNNLNSLRYFVPGRALLVPAQAGQAPHLPDLPAAPVSIARAYSAAQRQNRPAQTRTAKGKPAQAVTARSKGKAPASAKTPPKKTTQTAKKAVSKPAKPTRVAEAPR